MLLIHVYPWLICFMLSLLLTIVGCGEDRQIPRKADTEPAAKQVSKPDHVATSADWPMFMRDVSYSGISSDRTIRPPLAVVWKLKTGGPVNSSPVVVGETLYIGSDDHRIYALHARKWGVRWVFEAGERIIYAPTFYEGNIYFSARDNKVYALDAVTGAKKWDFQADGWINAPVVAFGRKIYFGCYDDKIYTLDAVTGERVDLENSSVRIGRTRYVCNQGEFYPMDASYKANRLRQQLPPSESWPATANGIMYIGARDSKLRAFDQNTGREIWQFETDGWIDSSPAIANGMLYIGSRDGYVYALENADPAGQGQDSSPMQEGVVTHDGSRVYDLLDDRAQIIAKLNEGRPLPITDRKQQRWYEVTLPDGRTGWMNSLDFVAIRRDKDLQLNDPLVEEVEVVPLPKEADEPSWSPDGSMVAYFANISSQSVYWRAKSIWLASGDASNPSWVTDGSFFNARLSWSGNGGQLAIENLAVENREIWVFRSNGTGLRKAANGEAPALSPRGGKVAFIRRSETSTSIWVRRLDGNGEEMVAEVPVQADRWRAAYSYVAILDPPAWSPGGSRLAAGFDGYHYPDTYSRVAVIDASGGIVREIAVRARRVRDISWSPDGSHLAFVTQGHSGRHAIDRLDKHVNLTSLDRRDGEQTFENCEGIAWSPDGRYLASIEENDCMGMRRKVWLLNVKLQQRIQLLACRENLRRVFWFTDGRIGVLAFPSPSETAPRAKAWILSIGPLPE